ncbi:plastocyanin/azurin family copper-binding protein [Hahella sp. HN01]|uniref:cupredoxin domain-containing protein n=1 Tax=Hahella sp. HN01 TaxID=2847262 RepID=UPI001C1E954A|nr:cupredoxin family protein [Hahella sp. HN01]MBU6954514.1 cupredoxin family protein [Hahella sp. HN01]
MLNRNWMIGALLMSASVTVAASGGHDHSHHHESKASPAGSPGDAAKVSRSIEIKTTDAMKFEPGAIEVKAGETVKLVITNAGQVRHEFSLGTEEEHRAHGEMMRAMPDMKHDDGASVSLEPGESREIVWTFASAGTFEMACNLPGHYEAGMHGDVTVK